MLNQFFNFLRVHMQVTVWGREHVEGSQDFPPPLSHAHGKETTTKEKKGAKKKKLQPF